MPERPASRMQLWQRYFEECQQHLLELDQHLALLRANPAVKEPFEAVQRIFHGFAGSGATYGAPRVSALGGEGEYMCYSATMSGRQPTAEELEQFGTLVRKLRVEFQALVTAAAEAKAASRPPAARGASLLLVTGDAGLRLELEPYLSKRGIQVEVLSTMAEAKKRLDHGLPGMAIVTASLPDGSGYDMVREIRDREPSPFLPILLAGESGTFLDKVEAIHCGADAFLGSPVDPAVVLRKLKSLLNRRRAGAARILAVEDDAAQARFLEATLGQEGYQIRLVRDPALFESEMYAFRPHLVLMDVLLPGGLSGYDLVRFLRQEEGFATVPVVFLSTEGQRKAQVLGAEAGGDDYLVKPIQPDDLVSTVRSRLVRFRSLQDLMDHDELTSLLAHVPFLQQARLCLSRFARRQVPYALVFLQVDHMDDHVRRYGPKVRDILVQGLARFIQRKIRQTDITGLYGEGQIAVVLEHLSDRDAARLIRRLQEEFASLDHSVAPGRSIRATFSAGVAMAAHQFKTLKDWIDAAAGALGLARQFGTGRTVLAGQQIPEE